MKIILKKKKASWKKSAYFEETKISACFKKINTDIDRIGAYFEKNAYFK